MLFPEHWVHSHFGTSATHYLQGLFHLFLYIFTQISTRHSPFEIEILISDIPYPYSCFILIHKIDHYATCFHIYFLIIGAPFIGLCSPEK